MTATTAPDTKDVPHQPVNYQVWTNPSEILSSIFTSDANCMEFLMRQANEASKVFMDNIESDFPEMNLAKQMEGCSRFVRTANVQILDHQYRYENKAIDNGHKENGQGGGKRSLLSSAAAAAVLYKFEVRLIKIGRSSLTWQYRVYLSKTTNNNMKEVEEEGNGEEKKNQNEYQHFANLEITTVWVRKNRDPVTSEVIAKSITGAYQHPGFISLPVMKFVMPSSLSSTSSSSSSSSSKSDHADVKDNFIKPFTIQPSDLSKNTPHVNNARLAGILCGVAEEGLQTKQFSNNKPRTVVELQISFPREVKESLGPWTCESWLEEEDIMWTQMVYTDPTTRNAIESEQKKIVACWTRALLA